MSSILHSLWLHLRRRVNPLPDFDESVVSKHQSSEQTPNGAVWFVVCGWTREFNHRVSVQKLVCLYVYTADSGICAECRPAESYLRQTQAGGWADAGRELLVVVQLWPWRRLWRTSVCQSTAGSERGETQIGSKGRVPAMKTVLSLHRKWAHAVKTIRILQGLVSAILLPWLRSTTRAMSRSVVGASGSSSPATWLDGFCRDLSFFLFDCLFFKSNGLVLWLFSVKFFDFCSKFGIWICRSGSNSPERHIWAQNSFGYLWRVKRDDGQTQNWPMVYFLEKLWHDLCFCILEISLYQLCIFARSWCVPVYFVNSNICFLIYMMFWGIVTVRCQNVKALVAISNLADVSDFMWMTWLISKTCCWFSLNIVRRSFRFHPELFLSALKRKRVHVQVRSSIINQ